jgi:hypothetical protein
MCDSQNLSIFMSDLACPIAMVLRMLMFHCVLRFSADPWDLNGESSSWMVYNGQSDTTIGWELGVPPFLETPINKPYKYIYINMWWLKLPAHILALWVLLVKPGDLENPKNPTTYPVLISRGQCSSKMVGFHSKPWSWLPDGIPTIIPLWSQYYPLLSHYYPIMIPTMIQFWIKYTWLWHWPIINIH